MNMYKVITDEIIEKLEAGVIPWQRSWAGGLPKNLKTKKTYRGINFVKLGSENENYNSPYWLTFKQAKDLGGHVKKGEKSTTVVFWKLTTFLNPESDDSEETGKTIPLLKQYRVFNSDQCEGIETPAAEEDKLNFKPIEKAEKIVKEMPNPPKIKHNGQSAYYVRYTDIVNMPIRTSFDKEESYYSVLFHELAHSTGHPSRLDRKKEKDQKYGSKAYSREELLAEMTSVFLCAHLGIEHKIIDNSAAYINGWLEKLKEDPRFIVQVAAQAQKVADYIQNIKYQD